MTALRRAVFLDRDGVINDNWMNPSTGEWESPIRAADVRLCAGAAAALASLKAKGFLLLVVSNQPSAAKGKCTLADLAAVDRAIADALARERVVLDGVFYAYKHPDGIVPDLTGPSPERKPGAFFLEQAIARHGLDRAACWMVGDRGTDIECGRRAGVRTIRVQGSEPDFRDAGPEPDFRAADLAAAAAIILAA